MWKGVNKSVRHLSRKRTLSMFPKKNSGPGTNKRVKNRNNPGGGIIFEKLSHFVPNSSITAWMCRLRSTSKFLRISPWATHHEKPISSNPEMCCYTTAGDCFHISFHNPFLFFQYEMIINSCLPFLVSMLQTCNFPTRQNDIIYSPTFFWVVSLCSCSEKKHCYWFSTMKITQPDVTNQPNHLPILT